MIDTAPIATPSRLAAIALAACLAAPAGAQTAAAPATPSTQWGLGLAGGVFQQPYEGADNKTRALPLLYVENAWLHVAGTTADVKLGTWNLGGTTLALAGRLKYAGDGYEEDDSPVLAGMAERKGGFWAGAAATWNTPVARASLAWTGDASGHSKGQQLQLRVDRRFAWGRLALTPRIEAQWLDKKYVDYYYGVRAEEARPGRPAYAGKAATAFEAGLRVDYQLQPKQTLFLDIGTTSLPGAIKDSPIVGRSSISRATIGYLYRF